MAHPYGTRRARGRPARRSEPEPPQPQPSTAAAGRPLQHPVPPSSSPSSSASQDVSDELQSLIRATVQSEVAQAVTQSVSTALEGALHPLLERLEAQPAPQADPSRVIRPAQNVPPRIKERILRGEFVEFDDLLSEALGSPTDEPIQITSLQNQVVEFASPSRAPRPGALPKRHVHDLATWMEAWTVYFAVVTSATSERTGELLAYQSTIVDVNQRFNTSAWLDYDRRFRTLAAADNRRWDIIDMNTYQACFTSQARPACTSCALVHPPPGPVCPFRKPPLRPGTVSGGAIPRAFQPNTFHNGRIICRNYNANRCNTASCPRAHVCLRCRGTHPSTRCKSSPSQSQ